MKTKTISRVVAAFFVLPFLMSTLAFAQPTVHVGLGHHGHVNQATILGGVYLPVIGAIQAGGDIRYLLSKELDDGDETAVTFNLNGRYPILDDDGPVVYAVAGFNYYSWSWEGEFFGQTFKESGNETGINIGAAGTYSLGSFGIGAEAKVVVTDGTPFVVAAFVSKTFN